MGASQLHCALALLAPGPAFRAAGLELGAVWSTGFNFSCLLTETEPSSQNYTQFGSRLSGALEAATGIEPVYRALQYDYPAANSLVRGHFIRSGDRFGNELGTEFRSRAGPGGS